MTEFTAYVTQRVRYRVTGEYDKPEDFANAIASGLWDDTDNEVEWDRVEVFDTDGQLVHDTRAQEADASEVRVHFQPQAWVKNYAIDTDDEGPDEWNVTTETAQAIPLALAKGSDLDFVRSDPLAPEWVRYYHGPFEITLVEPEDEVSDERASSIKEGWTVRDIGDDEWRTVEEVDRHGDTMLLTFANGDETTFDIDTVIERKLNVDSGTATT